MIAPNNRPTIIAILRGIQTDEAVDIAEALISRSIRMIEVPLNSPHPYRTLEKLAQTVGDRISLGAGTVLEVEQVQRLSQIGVEYVISPNLNENVVKECIKLGLEVIPGAYTPTEIFAAIKLGVTKIKLFPASSLGPSYVKAISSVLPKNIELFAVGGVDETNIACLLDAGVAGVGVGSAIYKPGDTPDLVSKKASILNAVVHKVESSR